jgi:hypothetical protein
MTRVDLRTPWKPDLEPSRAVYLREIAGYDELSDISALELMDRLLVDGPGAIAQQGEASRLSLTDADRVLAAIYRSLYGDLVECQVACSTCRSAYVMSFTLTDMWNAAIEVAPENEELLGSIEGPDEGGLYRLGKLAFRLPTGADLAEIAGRDPQSMEHDLRARCVVEEDPDQDDEIIDRLLSLAGPTLDSDLDSTCPECGADQAVPFRIDDFLMAALQRESPLLTREVHELARAYRWSRHEILEMSRRERRQHACLVLAETSSDGGWA